MTDATADLLFSLSWVQPELALAGFALFGALIGAVFKDKAAGFLLALGAAALIAAGVAALMHRPDAPVILFGGLYRVDAFAAWAKAIIAFSAAATLLLAGDFFGRLKDHRFELSLLTVLAALGMFVMASANDLIGLYMGIELQSLAAYVMAAFRRDEARGSEAGLKYFVLGALSSGLLLYGASLVYGFTGALQFDAIAAALQQGGASVGAVFGLVFVICGLAFKLSAAPFHMWTPDVYEGAPTAVSAFFAASPKVAAAVLFAQVLFGPFAALEDQWRQVIVALAGISLIWGSIAALVQTNVKRLMAYSSIANMGFVLMGLAAGGATGAASALLYLALYLPATIGVFAVLIAMRREGRAMEAVDDLAGLAQRQPALSIVLTVLFFSLIGLPPLAGFFGKIAVFRAALEAGLWPLVLVGAIATVIGAGYYLRVLATVWFKDPGPAFDRAGPVVALGAAAAAVLTFPVLVVGVGALDAAIKAAAAASFAPIALLSAVSPGP